MNYVQSLNLFGVEAKEIPCITKSGAPTTATVGVVGLLYMDIDNGDVYKCTAVNGSVYTWESMESSGSDSGGNVDQNGLTSEQISALDGMFKIASFTEDPTAAYTAFKTAFGISDSSEDSGDETHTHSYTSSVTKAATCETAGVRTYTCSCGNSYTEEIPATGHNYVDGVCTVCGAEDPTYNTDVTLSSISATYSGGDVAVGTAVTELTGIVVTAHYSDGSTETVSVYTLSGEITEGDNTITVTYEGMTTTFTVTGTSTGETDDYAVHNFSDYSWTNGGILNHNNTIENYANYSYSEYIPCEVGVSYETNAEFTVPLGNLYDEADNHLGGVSYDNGVMFIGNNAAKKMRLNALTSDIQSAYFKRYVHDSSSPNYVFAEYKWTVGSYIDGSGQIAALTSYAYSEYIPVESGEEILLCTNAPNFSIAFYNANKEFVRSVNVDSINTEVSITVASDEQYFILNASTSGCSSTSLYWKYAE